MRLILQLWFLATAFFITGALIWSFAPILVPIIALAAAMGGFVAVIVWLARRLERAVKQKTAGPRGDPPSG